MKNSKKRESTLTSWHKYYKDLCPKTDEELDKMSRVPYASAIGSIVYAMMCTRSDVSFALSMVSRHQQNLGEGHWITVKNILKCLRNTKDRFLVYGGEEELRVTGYCNASWQIDKDDSRLQSGWIFLLNGGVSLASKEATLEDEFIGGSWMFPTYQDHRLKSICDIIVQRHDSEPKDQKVKAYEKKYHLVAKEKVEEGHVL
ncbi:hypothetical protein Tco_0140837 [Tanacetum coccineum]